MNIRAEGNKLLEDMEFSGKNVFLPFDNDYPLKISMSSYHYSLFKRWGKSNPYTWLDEKGIEYLAQGMDKFRVVINESCQIPEIDLDESVDLNIQEKYWKDLKAFEDEALDDFN
jgi:hypothetical protein